MPKIRVIFYGSDKYSKIVLEALQKDDRFLIVKDLKDKPDVGVLASYGRILPLEELKKIPHGILNLHPSLLPKYRGPSPVQTAILNGESETGVTIIKLDEQVDHGPIARQIKEKIAPDDTSETLYNRLFLIGAELLKNILPDFLEGRLELKQQDHSQASYTQKLTRKSGKIDWKKPAEYLERFIRAMSPWPGAWSEVEIRDTGYEKRDTKNAMLSTSRVSRITYHTKRLKVLSAHLESDKLVLDQVQLEGKKPVTFKQFCEGYPQTKIIGWAF